MVSPFRGGDRKLKGAQINLKMRTKCGVVPGCQAAAEPPGLALLQPPAAASASPVTAPRLAPSRTTRPPSANQT